MSEFLSSKEISEVEQDFKNDPMELGNNFLVSELIYTCKKLREALAQHHKGKKFCRKCLIHVTGEKET